MTFQIGLLEMPANIVILVDAFMMFKYVNLKAITFLSQLLRE